MAAKAVKGMERLTTQLYIKQFNRRLVEGAGSEEFVGGKVFPPYVVPKEYWVRTSFVGDGAGIAPDQSQFMSYRAGLVEMNLNQEQVETDDVTGDELVGRYMHPEVNRFEDTTDTAESSVGIPHDRFKRSSWWKQRELFWYIPRLGLPGKAVFNDASLITYADEFRKHAMIKTPVAIDTPKFLGIGANTQIVDGNVDFGDILWGGLLETGDLLEAIYEGLGEMQAGLEMADAAQHGSALQKWLEDGIVTVATAAQDVWVETSLTVRCEVYKPQNAKQLTPF